MSTKRDKARSGGKLRRRAFLSVAPWHHVSPRILAVAPVLLATPALADMAGVASVIDGDTLEVRGQRIKLHEIDAPEGRQLCRLDGKRWQCGKDASNILANSSSTTILATLPVTASG
jgi:endonuclease YncB( thermonuclease family)